MGSLRNIDFGVFWASWGGSGSEWFRRLGARGFEGFGVRWVPTGYILFWTEVFLGTGVWEPEALRRFMQGSGDSVPKVPKALYFERGLSYFESML